MNKKRVENRCKRHHDKQELTKQVVQFINGENPEYTDSIIQKIIDNKKSRLKAGY